MTLGGWAITQQCFDWILDTVPSGSKVLEFGSGMGTGELVKHFEMTSIEQDSFWMNGFTGSRYIYAPIVDDWYSWEALENGNLENDYFLWILCCMCTAIAVTDRGVKMMFVALAQTGQPIR